MATTIYICGNWNRSNEARARAYIGNDRDPSAEGKITQPKATPALKPGAVEGALFQCTLNSSGLGGGNVVLWMIDPQYSWSKKSTQPTKDTIVGWATINQTGTGPGQSYELYPVLGSDGRTMGQGEKWYKIPTDYWRTQRDANL